MAAISSTVRRGFTVSHVRSTPCAGVVITAAAPQMESAEARLGLDVQRRSLQLAQGRKQLERYRSQRRNGHVMMLQREVDEISEQDRRIMVLSLVEEAARYNKRMANNNTSVVPTAEFNKQWLSLKLDVCHTDVEDAVEALSHMALFRPAAHAEGVAEAAADDEKASAAVPFTPQMSLSDAMNPQVARRLARRSAELRKARLTSHRSTSANSRACAQS